MSDHRWAIGCLLSLAVLARVQAAQAAGDESYACQSLASEKVDLASLVPGVIENISVDRGSKVVKGQVVATLVANVERAGLALAQARANATAQLEAKKAKLAYATRRFERNSKLAQNHLISDNDIDELRTDREVAALDVQAAQEELRVAAREVDRAKAEFDNHLVRSPIDGIVTERKLSPGDLVRDQPIVVIQKIDPLYIETALPVGLYGKIKPGTPATIDFDTPNVAARTAKVTLVDTVIEPTSNTFGIRIVLANSDGQTPAGTKCRVRFQ